MQSVAFARPSRPVTLRGARPSRQAALRRIRDLGRLALTALVLAVGLGGASALTAAAPASAAELARPAVVTSRVAELRPGPGPAAESRARPAAPHVRPAPGNARPSATAPVSTATATGRVDRPAVDPAGGAVVRRGPPRH
ncbi:hypothetical protein C5N14_14355 [Micromonospora sp. MW-13]|uniref:hypothetical protein n=1 Tax=Micromonospora sp. MW-13 TaxID=2094022 RepID=UPI000E444CAF|nr:hypothetical protein [Micromonospora sp. MW-13]RGC68272.1 hypothetical protein C5N14_14355 [Micromonospora sp. MW-13]